MAKKKWSDLTSSQKNAICVGSVLEVVLTVAASRDLVKRSADEIRGTKAAWALALVVQPFGPMAYFAVGRQRSPRPPVPATRRADPPTGTNG